MNFASRTSRRLSTPSNVGSPTRPIYVKAFDEDGNPYLKEQGVQNIYDIIQAHYDDTRIESIVSRYEQGDTSVLGKLQGFYADMTAQAKNLQEAENAMIKVKALYDRMPKEVKHKFSDLNSFIAAIGSDDLKTMLVSAKDTDKPGKVEETVKEKVENVTA